jgi:hypothetical protein
MVRRRYPPQPGEETLCYDCRQDVSAAASKARARARRAPAALPCARCEKRPRAKVVRSGAKRTAPVHEAWCRVCRHNAHSAATQGRALKAVAIPDAELAELRLARDAVALCGGVDVVLWCARRLRDGTLVVDEGGE